MFCGADGDVTGSFLSCLNPRYQKYVKCLALSSILLLLTVYSEIIRWKCLKQSSALGVPLCLWVERTNFLTFIIFKKQQLMTALELGNFFQVDRVAVNSRLHQTNMLKLPWELIYPFLVICVNVQGTVYDCLWSVRGVPFSVREDQNSLDLSRALARFYSAKFLWKALPKWMSLLT